MTRAKSARATEAEERIQKIRADMSLDERAASQKIDDVLREYIDAAGDSQDSSIEALRLAAGVPGQAAPTPRVPEIPTRPSPAALAASRREPTDAPIPDLAAERRITPPPLPARVGEVPAPASLPRILVIDDDPGIRESLVSALSDEGYRVAVARDGVEGLRRMFEMPRVDLILLDLMMPRLDGFGFLEVFDRCPLSETPVVLISAAPKPDHADDRFVFLGKPMDLRTLLETVRRHIQQSRGTT